VQVEEEGLVAEAELTVAEEVVQQILVLVLVAEI
jgi:hypothetical protein